MIHKLENIQRDKKATLLGVGPMSQNCVDAAINVAGEESTPIMLIASRRQIDSAEFGGGYVNKWTTLEFAEYVRANDKTRNIILARDHGGPWQNEREKNLSIREAMESAMRSYKEDIQAGFDILHIDPSNHKIKDIGKEQTMDMIFELYKYCWEEGKRQGKELQFEIGTEEQTGSTNTQKELVETLRTIKAFCKSNLMPEPTFVVVQCGTRVMEMMNCGSFDSPIRIANEVPAEIQVPKMVEICEEYNIMMKEHNTDYLSDEALRWHPRLGIHAANVAPEFGTIETKALHSLLMRHGMKDISEEIREIAYKSGKWKKWMIKDSKATYVDKTTIAGHYVFSHERVRELKEIANKKLEKKNIQLNSYLTEQIEKAIKRYLHCFRMIGR